MKILLVLSAADYPWLFQKIIEDLDSSHLQPAIHRDAQKLAKPRGIVISDRLWIPKSLKYGVTQAQNTIYLLIERQTRPMEVVLQKPETLLIGLSLSRSWLPTDDDRLPAAVLPDMVQHQRSDRVNMRLVLHHKLDTSWRLWSLSIRLRQ